MKLSRKQAGAIAALIVAVITGTLAQTGGGVSTSSDATKPERSNGKRVAYEDRSVRDRGASSRREKNIAGEFDYYSMVLSWSPTYCATSDRKKPDQQCEGRGNRDYAFVLHGLWPQYERGYPDTCWTKQRPFVPRRTINQMLDIMPSPGLVIHEYKKHGTCSGLSPESYYQLSRVLYKKIKIPSRYVRPVKQQMVGVDQLKQEFVDANPGLRTSMMAVSCRGSGNRLRELRFCFSREGKFRACGRNESQKRMCNAKRMFVPPVRTAAQ